MRVKTIVGFDDVYHWVCYEAYQAYNEIDYMLAFLILGKRNLARSARHFYDHICSDAQMEWMDV
jgi:hypothetical protein